MARDRLELHDQLVKILGSTNVYFQPPSSVVLRYPCIIYSLDTIDVFHAQNKRYLGMRRYMVTVVDRNPDSLTYEKILDLPYSDFQTFLVKDNLNQYVCSLYW